MAPTTTPARPRRRPRTALTAGLGVADPAVVVRAAPPLDPPYEESLARPPAGMDFLPGDWLTFPGTHAITPSRPDRTTQPADSPALPPPHAAAQRFVGLCVEILNGYRPAAHLRPMTHPKHYTAVTDQLTRRTVRVRMPPAQAARQGQLVRVRRMLLGEPLAGVAELAVVLEQGPATWAMAIRLERPAKPTRGLSTWVCTLIQVI